MSRKTKLRKPRRPAPWARVTSEGFEAGGLRWPPYPDAGVLEAQRRGPVTAVTFRPDGDRNLYAVNGAARSTDEFRAGRWLDLAPLWAWDPMSAGDRVDLLDLVQAGLALAGPDTRPVVQRDGAAR